MLSIPPEFITGTETYTTAYTYDANNRLTMESKNQGGTVTTSSYTYDGNGNLLSELDISGAAVVTHTYDGFNQLISTVAGTTTITYTYNAQGYTVRLLDDFPETLLPSEFYVIGSSHHPQYAVILCPCGCGRAVELNLNQTSAPVWRLKWHLLGTVSVSPSVWRKGDCNSHFFLRKSKIYWCP